MRKITPNIDTQPAEVETALKEEPSAASPASETAQSSEERRKSARRRSGSERRRKGRDLTPEEDNRRRQREAIIKVIPVFLIVVGIATWLWGSWEQDEYLHHKPLINLGRFFVLLGAGFFCVLLVREWVARAKTAYKERKEREELARKRSKRRGSKRRHRSKRPSGVRAK